MLVVSVLHDQGVRGGFLRLCAGAYVNDSVIKVTAVLVLTWLLLAVGALHVGAVDIDVWRAFSQHMRGSASAMSGVPLDWQIISEIRLPRVLLASLVGASLACAGAAMQGLLRNPLAEPGLIGVSGGAALAAVLVLYFGLVGFHSSMLPLSAVLGSCVGLVLVLMVAGPNPSITTLILAGVAVSSALGGSIGLALSFAPSPFAMQEISFWLMGSVAHRDIAQVAMILPFAMAGFGLMALNGRFLRALSLGEVAAEGLGFRLPVRRALVMLGVALLTGAAVAVAGIVGFVGLMVPHMVRFVVGPDPTRLLVYSALAGASFVLAADIAVQLLSPARELKLGVLMSLLGAPFFLVLLRHRRGVVE